MVAGDSTKPAGKKNDMERKNQKNDKDVLQTDKDLTHYLISPEVVKFSKEHFCVDGKYCKTIAITGYPSVVESNFLEKIIGNTENYDLSIFIEPYPILALAKIHMSRQYLQESLTGRSQCFSRFRKLIKMRAAQLLKLDVIN